MMTSSLLTWTISCLLTCSALIQCSVFLDRPSAGQILRSASRWRRANSHFLEEMLPGDLERECYEESCSQEEAAEIFHTREKTVRSKLKMEFWYKYINLNPCRSNPCLNGGRCVMDRGAFTCLCPPQYRGKTCESDTVECDYRNGGCMQYCRDLVGGAGVQCGCADGFTLQSDGYTCSRTASFPCGQQSREVMFGVRSLWSLSEVDNVTMETDAMLDDNSTDTWEHKLNFTEESLNASSVQRGNKTELMGEETRIVGGLLEKQGGSPWQVLLRRSDGYGFCGGTLVSDRWVISAAHCMEMTVDHITIGEQPL